MNSLISFGQVFLGIKSPFDLISHLTGIDWQSPDAHDPLTVLEIFAFQLLVLAAELLLECLRSDDTVLR